MNIFRALLHPKPEFVFRPKQALVRLIREFSRKPNGPQRVHLPWGLTIDVYATEQIGSHIWLFGVYDLAVCENLWRLAEAGELCVDVGANVGQMLSILAMRVEDRGSVIAIEPQPEVFAELQRNVRQWSLQPGIGKVSLFQIALSNETCSGHLYMPSEFEFNRGISRLLADEDELDSDRICPVETKRLDEIVSSAIGVLKIDVEGHELKVLEGAEILLREGKIRDIVFESHTAYPTAVTDFLETAGYEIFEIIKPLLGPQIIKPLPSKPFDPSAMVFNYLATLAPDRAQLKLRALGWQCLAGR